MDITDVFEDVRPYLADPEMINDFLKERKDKTIDEIIQNINDTMPGSQGSQKTDLRILLNALLKHK